MSDDDPKKLSAPKLDETPAETEKQTPGETLVADPTRAVDEAARVDEAPKVRTERQAKEGAEAKAAEKKRLAEAVLAEKARQAAEAEVEKKRVAAEAEAEKARIAAERLIGTFEKFLVYAISILVLFAAGTALFIWLYKTTGSYGDIIQKLGDHGVTGDVYAQTTTGLSGMRDAVVVRAVVMLVGFVILMLGSIFVLKGVEAAYKLRLNLPKSRVALESASPGVIMLLIGATLVIFALRHHSSTTLSIKREQPAGTSGSGSGGGSGHGHDTDVNPGS